MTYDSGALKAELIRDEGMPLRPYFDTTGHMTIGVGRNLDAKGISEATAMQMLDEDIAEAEEGLDREVPWWRSMTDARQRALLNMAFNIGVSKLIEKNPKALALLESGQYDLAAAEILDGNWHGQVGDRALRIAKMFREG